ncbi:unnamed protein product [Vitrella brassicaformis CCMP3155]|uniref:WIBG Mago-binding domain-containing protein n=2 Tax=Vitrella brassicaformis TaxID=1169539 RepID=A0A0G4ENI6_VITBC|nr:unnamed protein product [Vitrella brassicaformis CCMP3155]|eukprot:CEL99158.1 unnamed protein product [Vitrella brassicaformis CCMP3155]
MAQQTVVGAQGEKYVIKDGGERVIAASKRPDGTTRKEIRVREGYVPMEEQERFRSTEHYGKKGIPGYVPPDEEAPVKLSKNAKKRAKKREKAEKEEVEQVERQVTDKNYAPTHSRERTTDEDLVDGRAVDVKEKKNVADGLSSANPASSVLARPQLEQVASKLERLKATEAESDDDGCCKGKDTDKDKDASPSSAAKTAHEKKLRGLRKKLGEIQQLEEKMANGYQPLPEQLMKLSRKDDIAKEILELEDKHQEGD